jgi:hypothetical protein
MLIKKILIIFRANVLSNQVVIRITYFTYFWPNFILTLSDTTLKLVLHLFGALKDLCMNFQIKLGNNFI